MLCHLFYVKPNYITSSSRCIVISSHITTHNLQSAAVHKQCLQCFNIIGWASGL